MKHADKTTEETREDGSTVLKFDLPGLLSAQSEAGLDGEFIWPIAPSSLATLYRASPEHCRAVHLKAESAYGGGLQGAQVNKIADLTETGTADLFADLGLDQETYGNAFLQIVPSRDRERIVAVRRLPAITMSRFRNGYLQRVLLPNGTLKRATFTADEIIHLRVPCPMGRRYAFPNWIGAEGMLELAMAATRYNAAFFKNNAMPEYAVIFKGSTPTEAQKAAIRSFFRNEFHGVENAHRTLLLHTGEDAEIEIERMTAEIKDADFLKLLDAAKDRIPVAHGVPPRMLGIMSAGQLGGGGEVSSQLFIFEHLTLKPKRRRVLDQLHPLLTRLGLKPGNIEDGLADNEVAFRPIDMTPPKDDVEDLPALVGAGILDVQEARAFLPQFNGADGVTRSAKPSASDRLAALLERF